MGKAKLILIATLCIWKTALGADCGATASKWDLWKSSCLRGANIWQVINDKAEFGDALGDGRVGPPFSQEIFSELRRWGANFVNISHPGIYRQTAPFTLDEKVRDNLDSLLQKISNAGLYAVISFRTGPGRTEKAFSTPPSPASANVVWKNKKAQDAWVQMWEKTALRYKNHPAVIGYNFMVEPNSNNTVVKEWNPKVFAQKYGGKLQDWYPLAKRITAAIRKVDTTTPLLVSPMNWGDVAWLTHMPLMPDNKTVYVIHQYEPYLFTHQEGEVPPSYPGFFDGTWDGEPENIDKHWLRDLIAPADAFHRKHQVPIAVMEYGLRHRAPEAVTYLNDQFEIFEGFHLNHAIWLWETDYAGVDWHDFNFRTAVNSAVPATIRAVWANNRAFFGARR